MGGEGSWPLDATNLTNRPVAFYFKDLGAKLIAAMLQDMGVQKWTRPRAFLPPLPSGSLLGSPSSDRLGLRATLMLVTETGAPHLLLTSSQKPHTSIPQVLASLQIKVS